MKVFKVFYKFETEERFLNNMLEKGWLFTNRSFFGFYHFEKATSSDGKIRIDYRIFKNKNEYEDYRNMFLDFGWINIKGNAYNGKQYFISKNSDVDATLFSTKQSAQDRYKRMLTLSIIYTFLFFIYFYTSLNNYHTSQIEYGRNWFGFYTPGLWEKTGFEFIFAFLFELPLALLRTLPILLFPFMAINQFIRAIFSYQSIH